MAKRKLKAGDGQHALKIKVRPGQRPEARIAEIEMQGVAANARVAVAFGQGFSSVPWSFTDCAIELKRIGDAVVSGDTSDCERLLAAQVAALNWVFASYAQRAAQWADQPDIGKSEAYLRMALRAQAQARVAVQTLHDMKNPRHVAFVSQTNLGQSVQVNNGAAASGAGPAMNGRDIEIKQNELLGSGNGARVEPTAAGEASRGDSTVVPLAPINRATKH
jgi:hypothetical protein